MKYAADFKRIARNALLGKWAIATLTGFLASLMGAGIFTRGIGGISSGNGVSDLYRDIQGTEFWDQLQEILPTALTILVIWAGLLIVISGAVQLGYAAFNLKLVDHKKVSLRDLFSQFHRLGTGFCMNFLLSLFTFLWTMLLIIPGIIKSFSYAMTPYILADDPRISPLDAITKSRDIMYGNKWRLFCLDFSFIGWRLLCSTPLLIGTITVVSKIAIGHDLSDLLWLIPYSIPTFIGTLFLMPYEQAAFAAFYRDVADYSTTPF